ncbi:hypothetical protein FJMB80055_46700 [Enterobacter hormaechei]|nr:hypothetical protein [Enterobacter hormaechei]VCX04876.1 hypothetical protein BANRA_05394 [Escherichia coli]BDO00110.1 hypothetical protein KAM621c_52140 [Citrobacter braakii]BDT52922.1 hypothetical protein [Citrobacter freundii]GJJ96352.1 hypothetical protein TUM16654_46360 [Enterobacter cloacae]BCM22877.1 hypothetical protein [Enterobacter hormaechei subsp. xiangfangensis]
MQSAFPAKGWRLRIWYNETIDEEIEPQRGDCIELSSRADALLSFMSFQEKV